MKLEAQMWKLEHFLQNKMLHSNNTDFFMLQAYYRQKYFSCVDQTTAFVVMS